LPPDLIIYAIVAAGLVIWLRNILGTRHGDERERPNPFAVQEALDKRRPHLDGEPQAPQTPQDKIMALSANPTRVLGVENKTAESGLLDISRADRNFDINFFLEGAQEAFVMIVEAFAKGERETLKDLLDPAVYESFANAIAEREKRSETMHAEILAVRRAEVIEARLNGRIAAVTVRFQADEISVTKDDNGVIISGHEEKIVPMRDIWTFARDTRGRDPRWLVTETRGDFEGDNDIIPNSHS
jgi:predicted lipid-binding transport protein (Tim44 family)